MSSYTFDFDASINDAKYTAGGTYEVPAEQVATLFYTDAILDPTAPTPDPTASPAPVPQGALVGTTFTCKGTREAWINERHFVPGQTYTLTPEEVAQLQSIGMIK